ncbi:SGNH/GDSL hydrolase family protein [Negadavirga shengliensis]|uniref:SGNH/GDSL hydrolase family protein n=1 Tax=Negadavirga shengliensis TaxID=1389218 RepID=A0ABV9SXC4_9BACT
MKKPASLILILIICQFAVLAQDPERFEKQVQEINTDFPHDEHAGAILFTGSSSVRMWRDLPEDFPDHQIVNAGFGGSHASDLLYYIDELILDYQPKKVFIYEGDNDIAAGKDAQKIIETLNLIVTQIQLKLPDSQIILISAKPSIARWELAEQYVALNQEMKTYSVVKENVSYADVWTKMLDEDNKPFTDIFLEDNLHMNRKGYDIWKEVIQEFL